MSKVHNFSAGPGILPIDVLKQASEACLNFYNMNLYCQKLKTFLTLQMTKLI